MDASFSSASTTFFTQPTTHIMDVHDAKNSPSINSKMRVSVHVAGSDELKFLFFQLARSASQTKTNDLIDWGAHEDINNIDNKQQQWYKEAVFYEVYVRAFSDSNGDGHGDLPGLTSRLDYLSNLGVNCIWLLPIYPSPLRDDGYDVADYSNIHPDYGTLQDFKTLVKATHERNMRIIADFIPNHTSDQHEWFKKSRADPNGPYGDYYVWSDTNTKYKDARIIFVDTEQSNWTWDEVRKQYYWHRFFHHQPDLNFENPKVREEMLNVMRFWLDCGIDGFRVDAVPYLFEEEGSNCENLAQTHAFLKEMRAMMDAEYPGRIMLAEACQLPAQVREYFGNSDEFHMGFHFPVMPRIYMSIKAENATCLRNILAETPAIPKTCQWVTFLRNHDELTLEMVTPDERRWMWEQYAPHPRMRINLGIRRRLAQLMDNDRRRIELAHSMLLSLPGSPILYYGDEICMGDNIWLEDRNGVRTPMQWDSSVPHAGFSTAEKTFAPIVNDKIFGPHRVNVKDAMEDPSSLYNVLKHMIAVRRKHACFGWGDLLWLGSTEVAVPAWLRYYMMDIMLIVHNTSSQKKTATITLPRKISSSACTEVVEEFTGSVYPVNTKMCTITLDLEPYQFLWLSVDVEGVNRMSSIAVL